MNLEMALRALSNERRLQILDWLRSPRRHFPPQVDGDLIKDGVCGLLIARKLRVTQPTASEHLKILLQAGLIWGKRIKEWTFYKRDEAQIRNIKKQVLAKVYPLPSVAITPGCHNTRAKDRLNNAKPPDWGP